MLKLASLVVDIAANDAPLRRSFAAIKAASAASAATIASVGLASAESVRFTAALVAQRVPLIGRAAVAAARGFGAIAAGAVAAGAVAAGAMRGVAAPLRNTYALADESPLHIGKIGMAFSRMALSAVPACARVGTALASIGGAAAHAVVPMTAAFAQARVAISTLAGGFKTLSYAIGTRLAAAASIGIRSIAGMKGAFRTMTSAAMAAFGWFLIIPSLLKPAVEWVTTLGESMKEREGGSSALADTIASVAASVNKLKEAATPVLEQFVGIGARIVAAFMPVADAVLAPFVSLSTASKEVIGPIIAEITAFGDAAADVIESFMGLVGRASASLASFFGSIMASGAQVGNRIKGVSGLASEMVHKITEWTSGLAYGFRNAELLTAEGLVKLQETGLNFLAVVKTIPANLAIIGGYIAGNWRELVVDGVNAVIAVFQNLGENIGNLSYAIYKFITDPTGGFDFEWKPLLEGFKATAAKLPELAKPAFVDFRDRIQSIQDQIDENEKRHSAARMKPAKKPAEKPDEEEDEKEKTKDRFRSQIIDSASFAMKMRQTIFSEKDDTPKEQLKEQKKIAKGVEKVADALTRNGIVARLA